METPEAKFINMIMDRLHILEAENAKLKNQMEFLTRQLDHRVPEVHLTPQSNFTNCNDGFEIDWDMLEDDSVRMWDRPNYKSNEESDINLIDENHLGAFMINGEFEVHVGPLDDVIRMGYPGENMTLKMFIADLHEALQKPSTRAIGRKIKDHIEHEFITGKALKDGEKFFGMYSGLRLADTDGRVNQYDLLLEY